MVNELAQQNQPIILPTSSAEGSLLPGVDLDNSAALLDIMDGES